MWNDVLKDQELAEYARKHRDARAVLMENYTMKEMEDENGKHCSSDTASRTN